jgi:hypothetical protein
MNYNINLLHDNEKRSVALLSTRSITRISSIVLPLIVVFAFAIYFLNYFNLKQQVKARTAEWSEIESREKNAESIAAEYNLSMDILNELNLWRERTLPIYKVLINFMAETPEDLYLKTLSIQRVLELNEQKQLTRTYVADIKGIIYGDKAEERVINYKNMLKSSQGLDEFAGSVSVEQYDENLSTEDDLDDIVFTISVESVKRVEK